MFSPSYSLTSNLPLKPYLKPKSPFLNPLQIPNRAHKTVLASNRDADGWDPLSDNINQDMIILRKRIHEIKILEDESESQPSDWMQWEKDYYETSYASDVCDLIGLLQIFLMNTRPSLAIGIISIFFLSVPTSLWFLLHNLLEVYGSILSALHNIR